MPEFKVIKPSDTRWLAHERCVKVVKRIIVPLSLLSTTLYGETHEPEALEISKVLRKKSTISTMFLLGYMLPQAAKLTAN